MKFSTLSQFKKNLKPGMKVIIENKLKNYKEERIIHEVKSNHFTTLKEVSKDEAVNNTNRYSVYHLVDGVYYKEIRCDFEKAKNCIVHDQQLCFKAYLKTLSYSGTCIYPSNNFVEDEIWLKIIIL